MSGAGRGPALAAGIDGCRAGWIAAIVRGEGEGEGDGAGAEGRMPGLTELIRFATIDDVIAWRDAQPAGPVAAIDMPIGLPALAGPRECDRQARRLLGRRWMCVFAPPDRELLGHDFAAAREIVHRRRLADPTGRFAVATHETINIAPKIAELDRALRADPGRQEWLVEGHPELSFRELAGEDLASKRSASGARCRGVLIAARFPDAPQRIAELPWRRREVARDDVLDAYALLWTALRYRAGTAGPPRHRELGDGDRDAYGLRRRIVI